MEQYIYKYIKIKNYPKIWYFGLTPYSKDDSIKIDNAINGNMDKLNSYNTDKNMFDLLYFHNNKTMVHIINLKEKTVIDMSTLQKFQLHK